MKLTACWSSMSTKPALRYGVLLALVTVSLTTCSFAAALQTAKMPESLQVPEGFASKDNWNGSPMTPLEFTLDDQIHTQTEISVSNMVSKHTSSVGAVGFAIRRPG